MSTRSTTHFTDGSAKPTAIVYRHSDGYPEGAGADLKLFLDRVSKLSDTRFNDASYLAAKYVVFLAEMFAVDYDWKSKDGNTTPRAERLDFISVGIVSSDPGDIEYRYVVNCGKRVNGKPELKCYSVPFNFGGTGHVQGEEVEIPEPLKA